MRKGFFSGLITGAFTALILTALSVWIVGLVLTHKDRGNVNVGMPTNTPIVGQNTPMPTPTPDYDVAGNLLSKPFLNKLQLMADIIGNYYYKDVEVSKLQDGLLYAIMNSIEDPYTLYYSKSEYDEFSESTSGTFCGIGAQVSQNVENMEITIVKPFAGSPAYNAGVRAGDKVVAVNGEDIKGQELSLVVSKMKGEKGTQVVLTVYRQSPAGDAGETLDFTITRDVIEVPTVEYEMKDNKVGYIAVSGFEAVTAKQYKAAYDDLENQGMTSLIVDLRDNLGGLLSVCVEMADYMLPDGKLITYTEDKKGQGDKYTAKDGHECSIPVIILTNGYSASASEVFTGALKDNGVATSLGTTTFGKGIVQSLLPFTDGTAVKLTTSSYFTPNGVCIHGIGIAPDVEVLPSTEKDIQLEEALKILNK